MNLCNDCGACDKVCKADCIDSWFEAASTSVHASGVSIVCARALPMQSFIRIRRGFILNMVRHGCGPSRQDRVEREFLRNFQRRELLRNVGIPVAALLLGSGYCGKHHGNFFDRHQAISPPGSLSIKHFTSICTACHLCVASCPTNVLRPSFLEYGFGGMSQPMMDYESGSCNYDCVICGEVCPTGAIVKQTVPEKKRIQIGKAKFTKDDCVVVSKKKDCAACSEHCPTKAVHTVPYEGNILIPEVDDEICIGCGACEHACPTTPRKAINVTGNMVHVAAKKPAHRGKSESQSEPTWRLSVLKEAARAMVQC